VLLKWKADFGSTLGSCVILDASSVAMVRRWRRRCAASGRRNLLLDVCFFNSARMRASGRWNLLALVQQFYEPTSWRVLL